MLPPRSDVEARVDQIDPGLLRVIWSDEVEEGIGDNRLYTDLTGVGWEEAEEVAAAEEALIRSADSESSDVAGFERILGEKIDTQYPGEDFDEGPLSGFTGLDVGVMAAVAALSAAGCIPTTSCCGRDGHAEECPAVRFAADEYRLPLLHEMCTRSGCGLTLDGTGMLQLYAADVMDVLRFARQMIAARAEFESTQVEVACDRPEDRYLDEYDDDHLMRRELYVIHERVRQEQVIHYPGQLPLFGNEGGASR